MTTRFQRLITAFQPILIVALTSWGAAQVAHAYDPTREMFEPIAMAIGAGAFTAAWLIYKSWSRRTAT